jgi:hypothetical protein
MTTDTYRTFSTAYMRLAAEKKETAFLMVTPNFEQGPGIERDGLTAPRMIDPHTLTQPMGTDEALPAASFPSTTIPLVQRAGTRTLFNHVKAFLDEHGKDYRLVAVQSCGDLTMNLWHVGLIRSSDDKPVLCCLNTAGSRMKENLQSPYRCLVKWRDSQLTGRALEFLDLKLEALSNGNAQARLVGEGERTGELVRRLALTKKADITNHIEFALAGKFIIEKGKESPLHSAADKFQDVRHIFSLPSVDADGYFEGNAVSRINFGEYPLYTDANIRRAALHGPILVPLSVNHIKVNEESLRRVLKEKHYRELDSSPARPGEYRIHPNGPIEIFFRTNVYPFGVLGMNDEGLVCLALGGHSGQVGNTLEGVTRIAYDFFGCTDAMVLDEGFDTFLLSNLSGAHSKKQHDLRLSNKKFLDEVACFTAWRAKRDHEDSIRKGTSRTTEYGERIGRYTRKKIGSFQDWPLNKRHFRELKAYLQRHGLTEAAPDSLSIMAVPPLRSQMRAVIIYAQKST